MGLGEWGGRLNKFKLVADSHRNGEHSRGNVVSIYMMARWRGRGRREQLEDHFMN